MHQDTISPPAKLTPIAKSLPTVMTTTLPMSPLDLMMAMRARGDDIHSEDNYSVGYSGSSGSKETALEQDGALSYLKILREAHDVCQF